MIPHRPGTPRGVTQQRNPRPCGFCGRYRVTGDTRFCHDTDCSELWREFIKAKGEDKDRLLFIARQIGQRPYLPRAGETPEQTLDRLAKELHCEPRQVCDRVIAMLEERRNGKA